MSIPGPQWSAADERSESARSVPTDSDSIVGCSPALLAAVDTAYRVAETELPVLIVGATGVGKELIARYLHQQSGRAGEFVDLDCGALPDDLVEGILFGHKRGAFTGAVEHAEGLIERADAGTLFLDELGSLPLRGQAKLLRAIETGAIRRVGATRTRSIRFRLVAAVQDGIGQRVRDGELRLDLFQRVAGAVIELPPLAERPADILPLAHHFAGRAGSTIGESAADMLLVQTWPGNVRELRWTVERAALFANGSGIDAGALRAAMEIGPERILGARTGSEQKRIDQLRAACLAHRGDPERIAEALRIGRSTLYRWLKEAGLELRVFKEAVG